MPDEEVTGRDAGRACAAAGTSDVVDALVVVTATQLDAPVITGDPDDLAHWRRASVPSWCCILW